MEAGSGTAKSTREVAPAVEAELCLHAHDSAAQLWRDVEQEWQADPDSVLVLSGALAASRFRRSQVETIWGRRVITLLELWTDVGRSLRAQGIELPQALIEPEVEPLLSELVADLPELRTLVHSRGGLAALAAHLDLVEKEADLSYAPKSPIERDISLLRERFVEKGVATQAAYRSSLARQAELANIGYRPLIANLPEYSAQLGGLIKGLSRAGRVDLYLLSAPALLDTAMRSLGIAPEAVSVERSFSSGLGELFAPQPAFAASGDESDAPGSEEGPNLDGDEGTDEMAGDSPPPRIRLLRAESELESAMEIVGEWVRSGAGPAKIAVVGTNQKLRPEACLRAAQPHGVPLLLRFEAQATDHALPTLIKLIAESDLSPSSRVELLEEGEATGLVQEDLEALFEARQLGEGAFLRVLVDLAARIFSESDAEPDWRAEDWLDELMKTAEAVEEYDVALADATEIVTLNRSERRARGAADGVLVLSWAEVPAFDLERIVCIGLAAESYPPTDPPNAFVSEDLGRELPALVARDHRHPFAAACLAAKEELVLVSEGDPSAYFQAVSELSGTSVETQTASELSSERRVLQRSAHSRQIGPELARARGQAYRERLLADRAEGRRAYSVTELEDYLACPYGWFVSHVLRPKRPPGTNQRRGQIAHEALADLIAPGAPAPSPEAVRDVLCAHADGALRESELELLADQLERLIGRFGGAGWPYKTLGTEVSLRTDFDVAGENFSLKGRVDRLDLLTAAGLDEASLARYQALLAGEGERLADSDQYPDLGDLDPEEVAEIEARIAAGEDPLAATEASASAGLLVIDYKLNRPPAKVALQPFLYPVMAAERLGVEAAGFLYVSVRYGDAVGHLRHELRGLPAPAEVSAGLDWGARAKQAFGEAQRAIAGIEAGRWSEVGRSCPEWCAHRLVSETTLISSAADEASAQEESP